MLRTVRETDLDILYTALSDLASRGDYFPLHLFSEATFKREFHEHGFWTNDFGRLLICDLDERLLGSIWYFQAVRYYDGLEIGYHLFDVGRRNTGVMTEALSLLTHYLFAARKINRLQIAAIFGIAQENHLLPFDLTKCVVLDDHDLQRQFVFHSRCKFRHEH